MYCKVCQACFQSFWRLPDRQKHVHHWNYSSLSFSTAQRCRLCMDLMELILDPSESQPEPLTVWSWIPHRNSPTENKGLIVINLSSKSPSGLHEGGRGLVYSSATITENCPLMPACGDANDEEIPGTSSSRAVAEDTGSQQTWSHVLRWLKDCSNLHGADCNHRIDKDWVPTRLLYLDNDGSIRLQTNFSVVSVRYITLSHCWGKANASQPKLTSGNIESLKRNIDINSLSKTFQDAIEITRRLEVRFLWIDSLCIIQGDQQDWQQEASRMGKVYSNGMLNISAHSDHPEQGCFRVRDPSRVQLIPVDNCCPQDPYRGEAIYATGFWHRNVVMSPVNLRGWV
jgi:hypothetical protein